MPPTTPNQPKTPKATRRWWLPTRDIVKNFTLAGMVVFGAVGAFCWGRFGAPNQARGQAPQSNRSDITSLLQQNSNGGSGRVVAYIYNNIPITREELGEYLVQRVGADWVEFLVNHKIIEKNCAANNIHISDAEVSAQLAEDLRMLGVTERDFVASVLRPRNKTMFEYREDVIRPKLALQRFVQDKIQIGEKDIQMGFEAKFGPKVECRLIAITKDQEKNKYDIYAKASKSLEDFEREAKRINPPGPLQAEAGKVPPIHKHFPDPNLEEVAFKLRPGETSSTIAMIDGTTAILHCVKIIAADTTKTLDQERDSLRREIFEARVAQSVPVKIAEMRKEAAPLIMLKHDILPAGSSPVMGQIPASSSPAAEPAPPVQVPSPPPSGVVDQPSPSAPKQ